MNVEESRTNKELYTKVLEISSCIDNSLTIDMNITRISETLAIDKNDLDSIFKQWASTKTEDFIKHFHQNKNSLRGDETLLNPQQTIIKLERMTKEELGNKETPIRIFYSYSDSPFGEILFASTEKGLCYLAFSDQETNALEHLYRLFPKAEFLQENKSIHKQTLSFFLSEKQETEVLNLHLKGTDFQFEVWKSLLKIPFGTLVSYASIAKSINKTKASRAVGTAIGSNPVSLLVPCHRVIQSSGKLGGYMWGLERKAILLAWEKLGTALDFG